MQKKSRGLEVELNKLASGRVTQLINTPVSLPPDTGAFLLLPTVVFIRLLFARKN